MGCLLILSLLKPLVSRSGHAAEPHFLKPDEEPLLFGLVKELAAMSGMPEPAAIAVDCNVNSCTVWAGGVAGWLRSRSVLVVGLPLLAGLQLDQFAGVVAHELVHVAQTGRWSSRFIWGVNAWFSRVASEPDEVDEKILRLCETAGAGAKLGLRFVQMLFQPGRALLQVLMRAESTATFPFLRRMELEADRYQVRVVGTEAFVSTVRELNLLAMAAQRAIIELSRLWKQGQLADNFPGLIVRLRGKYSNGFIQRLLTSLEHGRTAIFSAHPADRDRIALARSEAKEGVLSADLPATTLLSDFQDLCREVTLEFYDRELRLRRDGCPLVPFELVFRL
jgi:Zn-dependent protease with chaperone function